MEMAKGDIIYSICVCVLYKRVSFARALSVCVEYFVCGCSMKILNQLSFSLYTERVNAMDFVCWLYVLDATAGCLTMDWTETREMEAWWKMCVSYGSFILVPYFRLIYEILLHLLLKYTERVFKCIHAECYDKKII